MIAVAGILIRLLVSPFLTVGYDSDFWATIIRNLNSGQGLYGLEGYYYTPVWGYILSFMSVLQGMFLDISIMGMRVVEAFPIEKYTDWFVSATVTNVSFNIWIKISFMISDLLVGYIVYWLVKDKTGDMKKATIGFALWFLCPLVIGVTSISGMFDTFSVLFILLCVVMIRKDKLFLAGILFTFAVLTKFFPVYFTFILLAYIIVRHRGDGTAVRSVVKAAAGALLAFFVIMLPQIIEGNLTESILFATNRIGGDGIGTIMDAIRGYVPIIFYAFCIFISLALAYLLIRGDKDKVDDSLFKSLLLMTTILFFYPPTPQYLVLLIPFLAIYIVSKEPKLKWSWLIISIGGALFTLSGNFTLLLSLGTFTNMVSLDHIMSGIELFQAAGLLGINPLSFIYVGAAFIQYVGILSVAIMILKGKNNAPEKDDKNMRGKLITRHIPFNR